MKVLLLYSYFETSRAKENLSFFNDYGMMDDLEYCLIVNGGKCNVNLNNRWKKIILRDNIGHDFAAWNEALQSYNTKEFDYFFFINDTVIGPIGERYWVKIFLNLLDEKTKLAGISIHCLNSFKYNKLYGTNIEQDTCHVQSMFWVTDKIGLEIIKEKILEKTITNKNKLILEKEIGLSQEILKANYNITCVLPEYQHNYLKENPKFNIDNDFCGDPFFPKGYFGKNINPFQSIFFKNSRFITPELAVLVSLQKQTKFYSNESFK